MSLILILALGFLNVSCDSIEDGWKGIKPFYSTRSEVETILGKPEIDDNGEHVFSNSDYHVKMKYSIQPCTKDPIGRGKFKIPAETVISYQVFLRKRIKLTDFKYRKKEYTRQLDTHVMGVVYYYGDGIEFVTRDYQGEEFVGSIDFRPSNKLEKKFMCDRLN